MPTHFWDEVTDTESTARAKVEKAHKAKEDGLRSYRQKLIEDQEKTLDDLRTKTREQLKEKQLQAKALYEDLVKKGEEEAEAFEVEAQGKIKSELKGAADYLFSELIGIRS